MLPEPESSGSLGYDYCCAGVEWIMPQYGF